MAAIRSQNQRETGDASLTFQDTPQDSTRNAATKAVDNYLCLPLSDPDENGEDTFKFWRNYSVTRDTAQKALCNLARLFLTPPPTSTDIERLFSTAGGE